MNDTIDDYDLNVILSQGRLLRSKSLDDKIFCKLNDQNRITVIGAPNQSDTSILDNFGEANKNFDQIIDDKERAEAYRDLASQLDEIIRQEKNDNLKNLNENSKIIHEHRNEIDKLETELKLNREQLLNSKSIINQLSGQKTALIESKELIEKEVEKLENELNLSKEQRINSELKINQLTEEKTALVESKKLIEKEVEKLNEKILKTQNLFEGIDLELLAETIKKIAEDFPADTENRDLNQTIDNLVTDINNIKPVIIQAQNLIQNPKMEVQAKDVIAGIPMFNGDVKQLDGFLNAADLYYSLVEENQKATVLKIIKAKITGDALFKAGPFGDDINTWALLKARLKLKIKKPISLEYAQDDLSQVFQKKDESIEDYGARVKTKLKKLNEASKPLTESPDQFKVVQKMNEKQAINKFEQNIRDSTIKVLVSAAGKSTLDECITFAMQKELTEKNKNIKSCTLCGLSGHNEKTCNSRKNTGNSAGNFNRKKFGNGNGQQNRNFNRNNQSGDQKQSPSSSKNEQKSPISGYSPSNQKNRSANFQQPKNGNNGNDKSNKNQKNVKMVNEEENCDMTTVKEALKQAENSKN